MFTDYCVLVSRQTFQELSIAASPVTVHLARPA